jgi:hypothetical protein
MIHISWEPYSQKFKDGVSHRFVFPPEVLRKVSSRITNEISGVNRVTYDISSKPPGVCVLRFFFLQCATHSCLTDSRVVVV